MNIEIETIKLKQPIKLKTTGGHDAIITNIDPNSSDCLEGTINGKSVMWNVTGMCRDNSMEYNFNCNTDIFQNIKETLKIHVSKEFLS